MGCAPLRYLTGGFFTDVAQRLGMLEEHGHVVANVLKIVGITVAMAAITSAGAYLFDLLRP